MIDPTGRANIAIWALYVWLGCDLVYSISSAMVIAALAPDQIGFSVDAEIVDGLSGAVALVQLISLVVTATLVARWIMRVNANAHIVSDQMTVSPGWNVGYFFVPFANLWKPFQGIRETWQASVAPYDPASVAIPVILRWWWGLWLASNALGQASFRLSMRGGADGLIVGSWIDLATFVVDVPLAFCLIKIVKELSNIQRNATTMSEIFA